MFSRLTESSSFFPGRAQHHPLVDIVCKGLWQRLVGDQRLPGNAVIDLFGINVGMAADEIVGALPCREVRRIDPAGESHLKWPRVIACQELGIIAVFCRRPFAACRYCKDKG